MRLANTEVPPRALAADPSMTLHHWSSAAVDAEHAEAAGRTEIAAERYVEAANHAAKIGDHHRAVELVEHALRLLDEATPAASHRSLRIAALITLGRIKWLAADEYTLPSALAALESAASLLIPRDHVELRAELAQLMAQVYYDIGGREQLDSALALLVQARRELHDAGLALEAARLLNDEAAVRAKRVGSTERLVDRLGELERAEKLLLRSRETFARFVDASPAARRELAQTNHLMARLALQAQTQNREELELALQRARSAAHGYRLVGDNRERARVLETQTRLLRLLERTDSASP